MKYRLLILFSSLLLANAVFSQQGILGTSPDGSSEPSNSVFAGLSDEEILAEVRKRRARAMQSRSAASALTAGEIDHIVLYQLHSEIEREPKVVQARLDLSDGQLSDLMEILIGIREVSKSNAVVHKNAMCEAWLSSIKGGTERVVDALLARDEAEYSTNEELFAYIDSSLEQLETILGFSGWIALNDYLNVNRAGWSRGRKGGTASILATGAGVGIMKANCEEI